MSLKDDILKLSTERTKAQPIKIDEWNVTIHVKPMTAKQVIDIQESKDHSYAIRLVAACACDEQGKRLFHPNEVETLSAEGFAQLFVACSKANDMSKEAVEAEKKG